MIRAALAAITLPFLAAGCFSREETIEVRPDGSATVTYEVEGRGEQLKARRFLPGDLGWELVERADGEGPRGKRGGRTWRRVLDDLNDYPRSFSRPGDPDRDLAPEMETSLEVDRQPGRTIYTFTRRYEGRRAGKFREMKEDAGITQLLKRMEAEGLESLGEAEREELFSGLAGYEAVAMWLRVRDALGQAVLEGVLDAPAYTSAVARLEEFLEEKLTGDYLRQFFSTSEEEQERELERLRGSLRREVVRLLPSSGVDRILDLLAREERRFQITESLAEDTFLVGVTLPGTIVATNAAMVEGGEASWLFEGGDLVEGDRVLTAVSVLER